MTSAPRVLVFGYSEVGCVCLELLLQRGANVVGLFTHADDPHETRWFRSAAEIARQHGVPIFTPENLKDPQWEKTLTEELRPDLILSFYYRHMIPMRLLNSAPLGAFNMHGSYLPKYRGKAPVNWAVLNGEDHIGATLHCMVQKADAGDIVDQERVPIGPRDTAGVVMARVVEAARLVLDRQLEALFKGTAPRSPQDHSQATYFGGRKPEDGRFDWQWSSQRIFNLIRALTRPYPGAFANMSDGRQLVVWSAEMVPGHGAPGEILPPHPGPLPQGGEGVEPLTIATADGALQLTDFEWR